METLHFERYEFKYFVPEDRTQAIRDFIRPYTLSDEHAAHSKGKRYQIYNLYLDSPGLDLYQASLHDALDRFKLRIRWYDDEANGPFYCEIKRKLQRVIIKDRTRVSQDEFRTLLRGDLGCDGHLEGRKTFEVFLSRALKTGVIPTVFVRYSREPYESRFGEYARLTLDREMSFQPASPEGLLPDPRAWTYVDAADDMGDLRCATLLELKFTRDFPRWMSDLVAEFDLERIGYSKYGHAIGHRVGALSSGLELLQRSINTR